MLRPIFRASVCLLMLIGSASAQVVNRNSGGNWFGSGAGGMGNAGGFATGSGMANSSANSNNFGLSPVPRYNYGVAVPGAVQGVPGVSNYGVNNYGGLQTNTGVGLGTPTVGYGNNMLPGGFVPGIAPPGFTRDMFGYDVGIGSGDSGYTNFGNAMTASALGLGFGGMGYGPMGYGPMGMMSAGPMGFTYPGLTPGSFMPGVGYVTPMDAALAGPIVNGLPAPQAARPGLTKTTADASVADNVDGADRQPATDPASNRSRSRRSFLNDHVASATANAIRIQNRLHNIKDPNFKNVKVLIASRTAIVSGNVDSAADEQLALRMIGLEPGIVSVKSELVINGTAKQP